MKRKENEFRNCRNTLQVRLGDVRDALAESVPLTESERSDMGLKVWLLPQRYYRHLIHGRTLRLAYCEFVSMCLGKRTLHQIGAVQGGEGNESSVPWTIGKGLLGEAMFGHAPVVKLIHHEDWSAGIEDLSDTEFWELESELRRGQSKSDFAALRTKYATAIACAVRPNSTAVPFGCLTAHMPVGRPLSKEHSDKCGDQLAVQARAVGGEIQEIVQYPLSGR